jgi:hypothetical protein
MTKPADDKLGHAKREIKALTGQLAEAKEHVERLEFCLAGQESISELLESLTESDGKLISKLHEQVAELEASAVVLEGWRVLPEDLATHLWDFKAAVSYMIECNGDTEGYWLHQAKTIENIERLIAAASLPSKQEPAE